MNENNPVDESKNESNNESKNNNASANSTPKKASKRKNEGPLDPWKDTKKTKAKRLGVKSVASVGDGSLLVTTFDKGNRSKIVLAAPNGGKDVKPAFYDPINFKSISKQIEVERGELASVLLNPAYNEGASVVQSDYLKLKSVLEVEFFGKSFPKDTIRIQIIYNLLDVLKIIGVYVNDIIYSVNNLQPEPTDVVGLSMTKVNLKTALSNMSPFFGFFGDAFKIASRGNQQSLNEADEYNGQVLRVLGAVRQMTAHFNNADKMFSDRERIEKDLKKLTSESKKDPITCWKVVESSYVKRIKEVNDNFLKNSRVNLGIIFELLGARSNEQKAEITQDYYRFSILKQGKNLGLNMKKLRETMLDAYKPFVKEKEHDTYRQKIYVVTDFLMYRTLNGSEMVDEMVDRLRVTTDDDEKDDLYAEYAEKVWDEMKDVLTTFCEKFQHGFPGFSGSEIPEQWLGKAAMRVDNGLPFVMLISFLCNFMEANEINELLTAFINKFENIQAMIDTLKELKKDKKLEEDVTFTANYKAFNQNGGRFAGDVARQLRAIVSIGKMKPDLGNAKRLLYKAAIKTLGIPDNSEYVTDAWLEDNVLLTAEQKKDKDRVKEVNPFRNFIANNVIESRRFLYLVRYTKPETVRAIMTNSKIVRYALSRLPESQINMYYDRTFGADEDVALDNKLDVLTRILTGLSFETLIRNHDDIIIVAANRPQTIERLKAQIGLYLNAAYLVVKNLVKTNARYYIAFSAFERDLAMLMKKDPDAVSINCIPISFVNKKGETVKDENPYYAVTEYYLDQDDTIKYVPENGVFDREACHRYFDEHKAHFTRKWRDIFRDTEIKDAKKVNKTGYLGIFVRNTADHLNALTSLKAYINGFRAGSNAPMKSYFELYHYIVQRLALDWNNNPACLPGQELDLEKYREFIETNGLPNTDLIHASYCTLGYNLPRYKNLTIAALFDVESVDGQERAKEQAEKIAKKAKK